MRLSASAIAASFFANGSSGRDIAVETAKRTMPREWFLELAHTHVALDDAIEQGHIFIGMLRA